MSALAIDEVFRATPVPLVPAPRRDRFGRESGHLALVPPRESSPAIGAPAAVAPGALQLTERGIAVIVVAFLSLFLVAAVVAVSAFLAVPNEPLVGAKAAAVLVSQG